MVQGSLALGGMASLAMYLYFKWVPAGCEGRSLLQPLTHARRRRPSLAQRACQLADAADCRRLLPACVLLQGGAQAALQGAPARHAFPQVGRAAAAPVAAWQPLPARKGTGRAGAEPGDERERARATRAAASQLWASSGPRPVGLLTSGHPISSAAPSPLLVALAGTC